MRQTDTVTGSKEAFLYYTESYLYQRGYGHVASIISSCAVAIFLANNQSVWMMNHKLRPLMKDIQEAGQCDPIDEQIYIDLICQIGSFYRMAYWDSLEECDDDEL